MIYITNINMNLDVITCIIRQLGYVELVKYQTVNKFFYKMCNRYFDDKYFSSKYFDESTKYFDISPTSINFYYNFPKSLKVDLDKILVYPQIFELESTRNILNMTFGYKNHSKKKILFNICRNKICFFGMISKLNVIDFAIELFEIFNIYDIINRKIIPIETDFIEYKVCAKLNREFDIYINSYNTHRTHYIFEKKIINNYSISSTDRDFYINGSKKCHIRYNSSGNIIIHGKKFNDIMLIHKYILICYQPHKKKIDEELVKESGYYCTII
jgi:hypothetical protein